MSPSFQLSRVTVSVGYVVNCSYLAFCAFSFSLQLISGFIQLIQSPKTSRHTGNLSVTSSCKSPLGCLPLFPRTCTTCPGMQSSLGHEMGAPPHRRVGTWASDSCSQGLLIHLIIACFSHLHFQRHLLPPVLATRDSVV